MAFQRLDLGALTLGDAAGKGLAGGDVAGVALGEPGRVRHRGAPRRAGLGREGLREAAGFRRALLVAHRQRLRQPHPGGRDAAGGSARVGHHGAVPGHGVPCPAGRESGPAVVVDMGRGADLAALEGREAVGIVARVAEREVAGRALVRGGRGCVLADREHRGREHGRLRESVGQGGCEERHRHREIARHHRHVRRHRPDPGLGHQRDADVAPPPPPPPPPRHERGHAHALGRLAHGDAVQHRVERPPRLQPHQPGDVGAEDRRAGGSEHQQHGHGERADVEALEDDLQHRHPGLGLAADGPIGGDGLGLGARLGVGAERGGVARLRRPLLAGVVDRVEHHLLAYDLGGGARGADEEVVGGRERRHQLGAGERVGGGVREEPPAEHGAGAGDDRPVDPAVLVPGGEFDHARGRGARRRRARRGRETWPSSSA